ncbi:hypothetical protein CKN73_07350 [Carnobacterium divergens]|uniref:hypothetical protein n=1 Tax=Carnobacterium divergens TaxID=2748 RepID=UPI001071D3B5|nr:hypothetical protein [Carnobacterium divergens]TFJ48751.1 hypothetical protein CKN73_07350 [Carnobacterium divergens]TFJ59541.1 hypothetical protein CKN89_07695 [Carnobacterium divergens]TFJ70185.1 hypothetical protein CKN91_07310 [Carnobacterium divergens]
MAIDVVKMMETDEKDIKRQVYPETTVNAVEGLSEALGTAGKGQVTSVNGKIGAVNLTPKDIGLTGSGVPYASATTDGIITKEMYVQLQRLINAEKNSVTIEKV